MMAAIRASQRKISFGDHIVSEINTEVVLLEKNHIAGKKLLLSGKGRCNITNACDLEPFLARFSRNGQFLRDAFRKFFNNDLTRFFEERGLKLKVERQQRVFPVTDKSSSVLAILTKELQKNKVKVFFDTTVKDIFVRNNTVEGVLISGAKPIAVDKVILATGGVSYGFTGSTGFGIKIAEKLGHKIAPLNPGLAPIEIKQKYPGALEGLTLKNIRFKIYIPKKAAVVSPIGELLFTDTGVSGPLVFSLSAEIGNLLKKHKDVSILIDLKPALSNEQLDARLLREFKQNPKKNIKNTLRNLLPERMAVLFLDLLRIEPEKLVSYITQKERQAIISLLKEFRMDVMCLGSIDKGMVTRGGVSLNDINPRTMESRIIKGLYFAGEMIDVDADTGGFNLQAAFSTGYLAGESSALN